MFLYQFNMKEGKAFMELAVQAMQIIGNDETCERAEYETYLTELNLQDYNIVGMNFHEAAECFKESSLPVKRTVIIELCGILYESKKISIQAENWIYKLSDKFKINRLETERLIRWSKDFSDFIEVGLMYINAKK